MDIDLQLFKNIIEEGRNNPDLLDSYSPNQFKSKERMVKLIRDQLIVSTNSEIVIFGCWYGSILIPAFKEVKRITAIDINPTTISIAKNRLFNHYKNVDFICDDVFKWASDSSRIKKTNKRRNKTLLSGFKKTNKRHNKQNKHNTRKKVNRKKFMRKSKK